MISTKAYKFVVLLGLVSLFADMTYESARSITGPFLATLGASAIVVGFVSGLGELIGYSLRMFTGYLADRTEKYWLITLIGYAINVFSVPLLALAGHWWFAAALIIAERIGKGIRTPPRDAMLSYAGKHIGMGWGFGLNEALDQIGAVVGPLVIAAVLYWQGSYQACFAILTIPALFSLAFLIYAWRLFPNPHALIIKTDAITIHPTHKKRFWIYILGASCIAAGYADFPLIAYHFEKHAIMPKLWVPITYAVAMGMDGFTSLLSGRLYDKHGAIILIIISAVSWLFSPMVFFGGFSIALLGVVFWSIGVGAQESLMRAIIGSMTPTTKRATAYGLFNTIFGIAWFLGSFFMGYLYDTSILLLVLFSVAIQLIALPILIYALY